MASNMARYAGVPVLGFDVSDERVRLFTERGGVGASMAEIAASCDAVFLSLPTNALVDSTLRQLIADLPSGAVVIDTSSTSPDVIRPLYAIGKEKGVSVLDSPVSGGESAAIDGTLSLMCGGDREVFDRVLPLLRTMGTNVTYVGNCGCGCVAKIANNMIVGCHLAALGEAFCFAQKAGLDLQTLFEAIRHGFAGSAVMESKAPRLIARDFSPSARMAVHKKDLVNAASLAESMGVKIPMSAMVLDYMNQMEALGKINEDHCAVAEIYEHDMGVRLGGRN